jgi:peroxiredoxin
MELFMLRLLMPVLVLCACESGENTQADAVDTRPVTDWRLEIQLPGVVLPAQLHLSADGREAWFRNGVEKVTVPEVSKNGQAWRLYFPAFNNSLELQQSGARLEGSLTLAKRGYEQVMQLTGEPDPGYRFAPGAPPASDFTGRWQVTFTDDTGQVTAAVGEFDQQGHKIAGTFLTAKGDYRYLAGEVVGDTLQLSTFDGAHAFVFNARMQTDGSLDGDFWSGTRHHETWTARRNFDANLPDAYAVTYLKEGYDSIGFSFPDLDGNPVSLGDDKYRGKVVLVTLSGSWCPNCADEIAFLSPYYRENRQRGLEIITLLYEHFEAFEPAARQGRALKAEHGVEYDFLVAGTSDKTQAAETLPMLNHVLAFPTMIFIDRAGKVRAIHTGFSGPGTGQHYADFVAAFNERMDVLLAE